VEVPAVPDKHAVATVAEVQVVAPVPQATHAPDDTKYPVAQVAAVVPEQEAVLVSGHATQALLLKANPVKQAVAVKVLEHADAPPGHLAQDEPDK